METDFRGLCEKTGALEACMGRGSRMSLWRAAGQQLPNLESQLPWTLTLECCLSPAKNVPISALVKQNNHCFPNPLESHSCLNGDFSADPVTMTPICGLSVLCHRFRKVFTQKKTMPNLALQSPGWPFSVSGLCGRLCFVSQIQIKPCLWVAVSLWSQVSP